MDSVGLLQTGSTVLLNSGFAWLVGAVCSIAWLEHASPALRRSVSYAALACLAGTCLGSLCAVALMGDVGLGEAHGLMPQMLVETAYGRACLASLLLMAAMLLLSAFSTVPVLPAAIILMAFALARASMSHAGEHGLISVGTALEWLHLLLVGVWCGVVAVAGWIVIPARAAGTRLKPYLASVSAAATLALAGIAGSGVYGAWQRMESLEQLTTHGYGVALSVKLGLFAVAAALGAYNRFVGFPAALEAPGRAVLVLRIESLVLLAALTAAAVLTLQEPPR